MLNYYDEIKNAILEKLEEEYYKEIIKQSEDKEEAFEELYDRFFVDDYITGNGSGSYYFNSFEARKQCYNYAYIVREALKEFEYTRELELFKTFEILADENFINVDTMEINEEEETFRWYIVNDFEEIKDLSFETLDVITRCYMLPEVLDKVLDTIF